VGFREKHGTKATGRGNCCVRGKFSRERGKAKK